MSTYPARLWQLLSPSLPVGAYSFSSGLEYAVDSGWITDAAGVRRWLEAQLSAVHTRVDLPALLRLRQAWDSNDFAAVTHWNRWLTANRETAELRLEDHAQGQALARLLVQLDVPVPIDWRGRNDLCWATGFALAASVWLIESDLMLQGYLWSWCENQVAAAVKLVPLGQTEGQKLLASLGGQLPTLAAQARDLADHELGGGLPGLALASALHENQYCRLFQS